MKKKMIPLLLLVAVILTVTASARVPIVRPALSFTGTTANCEVTVQSPGDDISVNLELWRGATRLKTWSDSGTTFVVINETYPVQKGSTYTLKGSYTLNGTSYSILSVSGTC
ncbi:MAG: hypothetical protein ACLU6E_03065 [Dysosmobacter welbionis]|jgi:type 1 fimbria pilin|uniref:hypothetical protein n=1 Tax=Dysosmobacter welbionis TaxID=2093857 RepID=UPI00262D6325|nr:hypothetical protein [uncultured Dysosmobacter sp.]